MSMLTRYAKAAVALAGVAAVWLVTYGPDIWAVLPQGTARGYLGAAIALLAAAGVARIPNARTLDEAKADVARAALRAGVGTVTVHAGAPAPPRS